MFDQLSANLLEYVATLPITGENPSVEDVKLLKSSYGSDVYQFTLSYDEEDGRTRQQFVLKTYTDNFAGKDRALKERHALYNLRVARYAVPGVAAVEIDDNPLGKPFIVMEYVNGATMDTRLESADDAGQQELAQQFVGLMTSLHGLGHQVLVPRMNAVSEFGLLNREIHIMRGLAKDYGLDILVPVFDWLYANRVPSNVPVVTHRDFMPSNVLLTETGVPFVIDWGWQVSDARYDLAWTVGQLQREGKADFAEKVVAEYQRTAGAVEHFDYFRVLAETRWLLNTLVMLKSGFDDADAWNAYAETVVEPVRYAVYLINELTGVELVSAEKLIE